MQLKDIEKELEACPYIYQPVFGLADHMQPGSARQGHDRLEQITDVYKSLRDAYGRELKVLDLGCNAGFYSFELAQLGAEVTGVELNPGFFRLCQKVKKLTNSKNVEFANVDLNELPNTPGANGYDLVLGLSIFHHIASRKGYLQARSLLSQFAGKSSVILELALKDEVGARGRPEGPSWASSQPDIYQDWVSEFQWNYPLGQFASPSTITARPMLFASNAVIYSKGAALLIDSLHQSAAPGVSPKDGVSTYIQIHSNTINIKTLATSDIPTAQP